MNDADTRAQKIAEAEADQQYRHETGGTVEERLAKIRALGDEIASHDTGETRPAPQ